MDLADRGRAELLAQVGLVFKARKQRQDVTKGCAIEAQRFCSQEGREGGQVSDTLDPVVEQGHHPVRIAGLLFRVSRGENPPEHDLQRLRDQH